MQNLGISLAVVCALTAGIVEAADTARPVINAVRQARPLHQHPTLVGMLRRNNSIRARMGLRPHRMHPQLTRAAQDHANYMAATGAFSHYSNGGPQVRAQKYGFKSGVLENIAWNQRTVDSAFDTWQASGGHMASIASGTSDAGFGYAVAPNGSTYWVGVYGSDPTPTAAPKAAKPAPSAEAGPTTAAKPVLEEGI